MLDTQTLEFIADELERRAHAEIDGHRANTLRIAAEDCRREAQAANGFANTATLALRIVVDNDRALSSAFTERAETIEDRSDDLLDAIASEVPPDMMRDMTPEGAEMVRRLKVSYLADDLRDFCRGGLREIVIERAKLTPCVKGKRPLMEAAGEMVSAMASHALSEVDWISVAREYLDRAEQRGEHVPAQEA